MKQHKKATLPQAIHLTRKGIEHVLAMKKSPQTKIKAQRKSGKARTTTKTVYVVQVRPMLKGYIWRVAIRDTRDDCCVSIDTVGVKRLWESWLRQHMALHGYCLVTVVSMDEDNDPVEMLVQVFPSTL